VDVGAVDFEMLELAELRFSSTVMVEVVAE